MPRNPPSCGLSDLGFDPARIWAVHFVPVDNVDAEQQTASIESFEREAAQQPGVDSLALAAHYPFGCLRRSRS